MGLGMIECHNLRRRELGSAMEVSLLGMLVWIGQDVIPDLVVPERTELCCLFVGGLVLVLRREVMLGGLPGDRVHLHGVLTDRLDLVHVFGLRLGLHPLYGFTLDRVESRLRVVEVELWRQAGLAESLFKLLVSERAGVEASAKSLLGWKITNPSNDTCAFSNGLWLGVGLHREV